MDINLYFIRSHFITKKLKTIKKHCKYLILTVISVAVTDHANLHDTTYYENKKNFIHNFSVPSLLYIGQI